MNFTTAETGSGTFDDFQYLQPDQVDDTFEPTDQPNLYKDLIGSGDFTFELLGSVHQGGSNTTYYPEGNMRITTTEIIPHIILKGITMIITMGTEFEGDYEAPTDIIYLSRMERGLHNFTTDHNDGSRTTPHIILKGTTLIKKSITQIMVIMIWSLNLSLLPKSKVSWQIS